MMHSKTVQCRPDPDLLHHAGLARRNATIPNLGPDLRDAWARDADALTLLAIARLTQAQARTERRQ